MPRQPTQLNRRPYTKVLSALLKQELIRLCTDFELPSEGSVPNLRDRCKAYLNDNREELFRNPRYKALYARHRGRPEPNIRSLSDTLSSRDPSTRRSPSALSYVSSPAPSFESWHGIEQDQQFPIQPHQPPSPQHLIFYLITPLCNINITPLNNQTHTLNPIHS